MNLFSIAKEGESGASAPVNASKNDYHMTINSRKILQ